MSAVDEDGNSIGQKLVDDKTNEIKAIPLLLDDLNIRGHIITMDAMGTQKDIARKIRLKRADYVLALKGNHGDLCDDVKTYFADKEFLKKCDYTYNIEKTRGAIEKREYWQTDDISWFSGRGEWAGLKSIAMTRNTIIKGDETTIETRYFISSLKVAVQEIARAIRKHWMVESYHHHLDVTFREDANQTLDKRAAYNLNIINKMAINVLKLIELSGMKNLSLKKKRYAISLDFEGFMQDILAV